ncbi:hypothetical protein ACF1BN_15900 [Streptomyces sp. NPDC014861]|uniref:hypothetical protein n=1 Tax=Streptomyces sp. NPDC014861 TaxID=3364923 RepID=UPI0037029C6A
MHEDEAPRPDDYPTPEAYEHAWFAWRAQQRDGRLNPQESAAQFEVIEERIRVTCRRYPPTPDGPPADPCQVALPLRICPMPTAMAACTTGPGR